MPDSQYNSTDMQRMERLMERANDKIDNVITALTLVQTTQAVQNTQIANITESAKIRGQELDQLKASGIVELEKRDVRLDAMEKSQETLRHKIAPFLIIGTIILSALFTQITAKVFNSNVTSTTTTSVSAPK